MAQSFVALYRGETLDKARMVAVSVDPGLVQIAVKRMLAVPRIFPMQEDDPVLLALQQGEENALKRIQAEGGAT